MQCAPATPKAASTFGRARSICLAAALTLLIALGACSDPPMLPTGPLRAADFADSLGVCVHLRHADPAALLEALRFLGVSRIRTDGPQLGALADGPYESLAFHGIRAAYIVNSGLDQAEDDHQNQLAALHRLQTLYPGSIDAVEGPNEVNNWPIRFRGFQDNKGHALPGGRRAVQLFQSLLYQKVRRDPSMRSVPVLDYTDIHVELGQADASNVHIYPKNNRMDEAAEAAVKRMRSLAPYRPWVSTEWGYTTPAPPGRRGVTLEEQADTILEGWAELGRLRFWRSYIYDLHDDGADTSDPEDHYGLFDRSWRPKPAAVALANLIQLIRDNAPDARRFSPRQLAFEAPGWKTLLLEKADGLYVLLAWPRKFHETRTATMTFSEPLQLEQWDVHSGTKRRLGTSASFTAPNMQSFVVLEIKRRTPEPRARRS